MTTTLTTHPTTVQALADALERLFTEPRTHVTDNGDGVNTWDEGKHVFLTWEQVAQGLLEVMGEGE